MMQTKSAETLSTLEPDRRRTSSVPVRGRGFTLVELMITIAVAAILATIVVPGFQSLFNRNRVATASNDFLAALYYARSEAVKNSKVTTICMSANQTACSTTSGWVNGWIVFLDSNANGTLDTGDTVLRSHNALNDGNVAIGDVAANQTHYSFDAQGALTAVNIDDVVNVCTPNDLSLSRQIEINSSGLITTRAPTAPLSTCP